MVIFIVIVVKDKLFFSYSDRSYVLYNNEPSFLLMLVHINASDVFLSYYHDHFILLLPMFNFFNFKTGKHPVPAMNLILYVRIAFIKLII